MIKTPLRYPGGKSRAVKKMAPYFPDLSNYTSYSEPFIGGGSVALWVAQTYPDLPIHINDLHTPLYHFWTTLRDNRHQLVVDLLYAKGYYSTPDEARVLFNKAKDELDDADPYMQAFYFYIINKCSFSGLTESSSFSPQASISNFSARGIERLLDFDFLWNWKITNNFTSINSC